MFYIVGGNYNGVDYSTMYHRSNKYENVSPNQKYYLHLGNVDDENGPTEQYAILVFDIATNNMVYAEPLIEKREESEMFESYQHRITEKLYEKFKWMKN